MTETIRAVRKTCCCLLGFLALAITASGHVVNQISGEWKAGPPWEIDVLFDAGYAVPEWRGDGQAPAPQREWLVAMGESGWAPLRQEAERYLRECLQVNSAGKTVGWRVEFTDFAKNPPDFVELLTDAAYLRLKLTADAPIERGAQLHWREGARPSFVLKLPGKEAGYLTLAPGQSQELPSADSAKSGRHWWVETFRQGYLHVLRLGLDHLLFVLGLFFYRRDWRSLLWQSLAFTLAHTATLGLAAAGLIRAPGHWVEPMIALSVMVVALENLKSGKKSAGPVRLAIVFGFGLIHGLGFAGALASWLKPGAGFLPALLCANLGVEFAQTTLLAAAWMLTLGWNGTATYRRCRAAACLVITSVAAFWFIQRIGWVS